jgi:hypothetical protein
MNRRIPEPIGAIRLRSTPLVHVGRDPARLDTRAKGTEARVPRPGWTPGRRAPRRAKPARAGHRAKARAEGHRAPRRPAHLARSRGSGLERLLDPGGERGSDPGNRGDLLDRCVAHPLGGAEHPEQRPPALRADARQVVERRPRLAL